METIDETTHYAMPLATLREWQAQQRKQAEQLKRARIDIEEIRRYLQRAEPNLEGALARVDILQRAIGTVQNPL